MVPYSVLFLVAGLSICVGYALAYIYFRISTRETFLVDNDYQPSGSGADRARSGS